MKNMPKFLQLWFSRDYDSTETRAAERRVDEQANRIGDLLPILIAHRERNHFADRMWAAFAEERR